MFLNISSYNTKCYVIFILFFIIFFFPVKHSIYCQESGNQVQLANGIYLVLDESENLQKIPNANDEQALLVDKHEFFEASANTPICYLLVSKRSYVPLILESLPTKEKAENGKHILFLKLDEKHVSLFKEFTGKHIGSKAAVIIGSKVVTVHKIRSEISDGRVQISFCSANACEVLYIKLTESFHLK